MTAPTQPPELVPTAFDKVKYKLYALILFLIIAVFTVTCLGFYAQWFTTYRTVLLNADRAGLQMYPGNRVQMRGVDVGEVGDIRYRDDGRVQLSLNMMPDKIESVPVNATVQLSQLTAFGSKAVQLTDPAGPADRPLREGDTLASGNETVEVNNLFSEVTRILDTAQPAKVNAVLTGLAQALDGRGEKIGQTAVDLSAYLRRFNANLPTLQRDFARAADVTNLYADVAPDLLDTLDNVRVPSRTLVEQQAQLDSLFYQLTRFSNTGRTFVADNADALDKVTGQARSITSLLKKYAPGITCFIQGATEFDRRMKLASGALAPGIVSSTTAEPGSPLYKNPEERPVIASDTGPDCKGLSLPYVPGNKIPAGLLRNVDRGGEPNPEGGKPGLKVGEQPLVVQLFGPLAGLPLTPLEQGKVPNAGTVPPGGGR